MKKIISCICFLVFTLSISFAQTYTTPNNGVNWTLDDIALNSPLNGQVVLRICLINPRTTLTDIKETLLLCEEFMHEKQEI